MKGLLAFFTMTFATVGSVAQTWTEAEGGGDAGDLVATAQVTTGAGPLTTIYGSVDEFGDADLFAVNIVDPAAFTADTLRNFTRSDTQLFLFGGDGLGITFNDDAVLDIFQSIITGKFVLNPGIYYLAISCYDFDPVSNGGEIWQDEPFDVERAPDGPGAGSPLEGWLEEDIEFGPYQIDLVGVEYASVSEPVSLLALGGLAGLAVWRSR